MMSGKVTDYLNYRQATVTSGEGKNNEAGVGMSAEADEKVKHNAGFY